MLGATRKTDCGLTTAPTAVQRWMVMGMDKLKHDFLRFVVWMLITIGISELWKFTDVAMYGYSQRSATDALMAVFLTNWIDSKIWG